MITPPPYCRTAALTRTPHTTSAAPTDRHLTDNRHRPEPVVPASATRLSHKLHIGCPSKYIRNPQVDAWAGVRPRLRASEYETAHICAWPLRIYVLGIRCLRFMMWRLKILLASACQFRMAGVTCSVPESGSHHSRMHVQGNHLPSSSPHILAHSPS